MSADFDRAAAIDELRYQKSESDQHRRRAEMSEEDLSRKQMDMRSIPGWLNAPGWANWIQFCSTRGWLFASEEPHVFRDKHVSVHGAKIQRACEISGVMFFENKHGYSGVSTPHWVDDRRRHLAKATGAA